MDLWGNNLDETVQNLNLNKDGSHFFHLYKNEGRLEAQRQRRSEAFLLERAAARRRRVDVGRALAEGSAEETNCFYRKIVGAVRARWGGLMMLAEWFLAVPEAFEEAYVVKMCPEGRHVLVVSCKGKTSVYNKAGKFLTCFNSSLPGGGLDTLNTGAQSAVLDCIMDETEGVIYILDIIYYLKQDFQSMTAALRFNWLDEYMSAEFSSYSQSLNNYRFEVVPYIPCDRESLSKVFSCSPPYKIDGLLFYMKESSYCSGSTYYVTWLKPYMVPELLSIDVHKDLMSNMPMDYENYKEAIINYNKTYGFKVEKKIIKSSKRGTIEDDEMQ